MDPLRRKDDVGRPLWSPIRRIRKPGDHKARPYSVAPPKLRIDRCSNPIRLAEAVDQCVVMNTCTHHSGFAVFAPSRQRGVKGSLAIFRNYPSTHESRFGDAWKLANYACTWARMHVRPRFVTIEPPMARQAARHDRPIN